MTFAYNNIILDNGEVIYVDENIPIYLNDEKINYNKKIIESIEFNTIVQGSNISKYKFILNFSRPISIFEEGVIEGGVK